VTLVLWITAFSRQIHHARAMMRASKRQDLMERITNHPHASAGIGALCCLSLAALLIASPFIFPELAPVGVSALILLLLAAGIALLSKLAVSALEYYFFA
jgi:hypothetical protein